MDGFTDAQQRVIAASEGALAVIAGPGTGKTTTLAGRIAYLVRERHADPTSILALSFTTEAARRLRREVARQLGDRAQDVAILTLHALGRKVIDTWAGQLGYDDRPAVVHHAEARALLASAATSLGWDPATLPLEELATAVDRCRLLADEPARRSDPLARLADAYERRLRRHGAIDFVAMLALPLQLFRADARILRMLQDAYRWIIADEAQDLDPTQWTLIELLAARHGNLLVAGDVAQGIFHWRGADHRALATFPERYPGATVITLDTCHRSTGHLVALGNVLSDLLAYRPPLKTNNPPGPFPRLLLAEDEHAEAEFVAQQIGALLDRGLLPHPGEAAVLFRTRAQADVVAGALRAVGVPYVLARFQQVLERAGLPKRRMHDLRHTYATRLFALGQHPRAVQDLLGHSRFEITMNLYTATVPEVLREAAERMDSVIATARAPLGAPSVAALPARRAHAGATPGRVAARVAAQTPGTGSKPASEGAD